MVLSPNEIKKPAVNFERGPRIQRITCMFLYFGKNPRFKGNRHGSMKFKRNDLKKRSCRTHYPSPSWNEISLWVILSNSGFFPFVLLFVVSSLYFEQKSHKDQRIFELTLPILSLHFLYSNTVASQLIEWVLHSIWIDCL